MKLNELKEIASSLGEDKIIKMIKAETKKLRKRDGMVSVADMVDGLIAEMQTKSEETK
jgi:hypothetical protein|tara:strand:- start:1652 stop:1825 length:174 start_codon:yes stop_codon:yes gene_type:complete